MSYAYSPSGKHFKVDLGKVFRNIGRLVLVPIKRTCTTPHTRPSPFEYSCPFSVSLHRRLAGVRANKTTTPVRSQWSFAEAVGLLGSGKPHDRGGRGRCGPGPKESGARGRGYSHAAPLGLATIRAVREHGQGNAEQAFLSPLIILFGRNWEQSSDHARFHRCWSDFFVIKLRARHIAISSVASFSVAF